MIYVVFDSSVIVKDYRLRNVHLKALLEESKKETISVAIPEVVFAEVVNKRLEEYTALCAHVKNHRSRLADESSIVMPDPTEEADRYAKWLRKHLDEHSVRWIGIPDVSHETLLRYALQKRKPFQDNGAGYRDALIWESAKRLLVKDRASEVLFLSYDKGDFAASKHQGESLHPDLVNDLRASGLRSDQIILATEASVAVEKLVTPAEATKQWFGQRMRDDELYRRRIVDTLVENLDKTIQVLDVDLRYGEVVRSIGPVRPIYGSGRDFKAWVTGKSRIGVEFKLVAEIDVELEINDQRPRGGSSLEEPLTESQTLFGLINGQLEIPEGKSDQILGAYAYIARLGGADPRLAPARSQHVLVHASVPSRTSRY